MGDQTSSVRVSQPRADGRTPAAGLTPVGLAAGAISTADVDLAVVRA